VSQFSILYIPSKNLLIRYTDLDHHRRTNRATATLFVLEPLFFNTLSNFVWDNPLHRLGLDCEAPAFDTDQEVDTLDALGRFDSEFLRALGAVVVASSAHTWPV
jgi:hypothetical protein